ncbi:hypothetical protein MXZ84_10675, partial [Streptococcus uberis]|nr:hypothetical protein [Streptococcus uberis]
SITVIFGFLIAIYKFLVVEPDNRMAQKINDQNNKALRDTVEPLTEQIKLLNMTLDITKQQSDEVKKKRLWIMTVAWITMKLELLCLKIERITNMKKN